MLALRAEENRGRLHFIFVPNFDIWISDLFSISIFEFRICLEFRYSNLLRVYCRGRWRGFCLVDVPAHMFLLSAGRNRGLGRVCHSVGGFATMSP